MGRKQRVMKVDHTVMGERPFLGETGHQAKSQNGSVNRVTHTFAPGVPLSWEIDEASLDLKLDLVNSVRKEAGTVSSPSP